MWIYSLSVILLSFGLQCCVVGAEQCGTKVCSPGEVCDDRDGSATCYGSSSKKYCSAGLYCNIRQKCCGAGRCCAENSECCGLYTCCPSGTCCGFDTCCAAGSNCNQGVCTRNRFGTYQWWYIILFVSVILSIVAGVLRRSRRRAILAARGIPTRGTAVLNATIESQEHYGYDQPTNPAYPIGVSAPVPPPYTPVANVPISHPPPPYNEVVNPQA